jgi:hypothetical protein
MVEALGGGGAARTAAARRRKALAETAMLVGSLTLARATRGDAISDEFLAAARAALLGEAGDE